MRWQTPGLDSGLWASRLSPRLATDRHASAGPRPASVDRHGGGSARASGLRERRAEATTRYQPVRVGSRARSSDGRPGGDPRDLAAGDSWRYWATAHSSWRGAAPHAGSRGGRTPPRPRTPASRARLARREPRSPARRTEAGGRGSGAFSPRHCTARLDGRADGLAEILDVERLADHGEAQSATVGIEVAA